MTRTAGTHSQEYTDAFEQGRLNSLGSQAIQDAEKHSTPKAMRAEWKGGQGEAGNYVELNAGGGIAGFNINRDDGV